VTMKINTDLKQTVGVHFQDNDWRASPIKEVRRKMLERHTTISGIATSLVEYQKNSYFTEHTHTYGEEFYVLDGVFSDEHGDYVAGTYVRNPPGTSHSPAVNLGCTIFVKLGQFQPGDDTPVIVDTGRASFQALPERPGVNVLPLHQYRDEQVAAEIWSAQQSVSLANTGGIEILVLAGSFTYREESFDALDWLRLPIGEPLHAQVANVDCNVLLKRGHHIGHGLAVD